MIFGYTYIKMLFNKRYTLGRDETRVGPFIYKKRKKTPTAYKNTIIFKQYDDSKTKTIIILINLLMERNNYCCQISHRYRRLTFSRVCYRWINIF